MPATQGQQLANAAAAAATWQSLSLQQEGGAITIVDGLVVAGAVVAVSCVSPEISMHDMTGHHIVE